MGRYSLFIRNLTIDQNLPEDTLKILFSTFEHINQLTLKKIKISPNSLSVLATKCQRLTQISLRSVEIAEDINKPSRLKSIKFSDNLTQLKLAQSKFNFESGIFKKFLIDHSNVQIVDFFLSDELFLQPFLTNYPRLKKLDIFSKSSKTGTVACKILEHNPQISNLAITLDSLSKKLLELIFNIIPGLVSLGLGTNKTPPAFSIPRGRYPKLKHLDLSLYNEKKAELPLLLMSKCPNLEALAIFVKHNTKAMMFIIEQFLPNLRDITFVDDPITIGEAQTLFPWLTQINDSELMDRQFQCAKNLRYLKFINILIGDMASYHLKQFEQLYLAEFEIQTNSEGFDCGDERYIEEYFNSHSGMTFSIDKCKGIVTGNIYHPNVSMERILFPNFFC